MTGRADTWPHIDVMVLRVFAALPIPDEIADPVLDLMTGVPDAKWRPRANLHVTLAFYGELTEPVVEELDSALGLIVQAPFELQFAGAGHFGGAEPSSLWLGVADCPALEVLSRRCVRAARDAGVPVDRRSYKPHLTLAYLPASTELVRVQRFEQRLNLYRSDVFEVDRFHLYSSWSGKPGRPNAYQIEAEYPLLRG